MLNLVTLSLMELVERRCPIYFQRLLYSIQLYIYPIQIHDVNNQDKHMGTTFL